MEQKDSHWFSNRQKQRPFTVVCCYAWLMVHILLCLTHGMPLETFTATANALLSNFAGVKLKSCRCFQWFFEENGFEDMDVVRVRCTQAFSFTVDIFWFPFARQPYACLTHDHIPLACRVGSDQKSRHVHRSEYSCNLTECLLEVC